MLDRRAEGASDRARAGGGPPARARPGAAPILLLDEVVAHLDEERRSALFDELVALGTQAWLTGTDRALFAALDDRAQFLDVADGAVRAAEPDPDRP